MNWKFWKENRAVSEVSTKTKTNAPVQMALLVEMVRMLQEYQQNANLPDMPSPPLKSESLLQLERMGFTNSVEWKDYKQRMALWNEQMKVRIEADQYCNRIRQAIEVLKDARRRFGQDTLLVPFDHFERLMNKYNLVCGTFDAYTGDVPLDKMADIATLNNCVNGCAPCYINRLRAVTNYEVISRYDFGEIPNYIIRFPFVNPHFDVLKTKDFHGNGYADHMRWGYKLKFGQDTRLFICAPSKDMKKVERIFSLRTYNDPFICAHTNNGILVFTRWGEEADDAIVKKYELVSNLLTNMIW